MKITEQIDPNQTLKFLNSNWRLSDYLKSNDNPYDKTPLFLLFETGVDDSEEFVELCVMQVSFYLKI